MKFELVTSQMLEGALKSFKDVDVDAQLLNYAKATDLTNYATTSELNDTTSRLQVQVNKKIDKSQIKVIRDGDEEPTLSDGQILIICEVE